MPDLLTIYTDGASRGNPGEAAYAFVIEQHGRPAVEDAGKLGRMTNNQAEYTALVRALKRALDVAGDFRVLVHSDSELMVKQMNGEYRVKDAGLRDLYDDAQELVGRFPGRVSFQHVRRAQNARADELCNLVLDGKWIPERPAVSPATAEGRATRGLATDGLDLHAEALAVLKDTAGRSPEDLWADLLLLLDRHGVALPGRKR